MTSVVRFYEDLTVLTPVMHYQTHDKLTKRARKYMGFTDFLLRHGEVKKGNIIPFRKRFAMDFVGDVGRDDLYAVNRALTEIRKTDFEWTIQSHDGGDPIVFKGNPISFVIDTGERGYAAIKVDPDFIESVRGQKNSLTEIMFAYGFLLADVDYAYKHAVLFASIWEDAVKENPNVTTAVGTLSLPYYRQFVGAEDIHPSTRDLIRKITKPCLKANNERTRLDAEHSLESNGQGRAATHIIFKIIKKRSYQLPMVFEYEQLERFHSDMQEVVSFDELLTVSKAKQISAPRGFGLDDLQKLEASNPLFEISEKILALGIVKADLITAVNRWGELGVSELWESFEKRRSSKTSKTTIDNPVSYFGSMLKSGKGRKTPEQRADEKRRAKEIEQLAAAQKQRNIEAQSIEEKVAETQNQYYVAFRIAGLELLNTKSDSERAECVKEIALPPLMRERWKVAQTDLKTLDQSDRTDAYIMTELARKAFDMWGDDEKFTLASFCDREGVSDEVRGLLKAI